MSAFLRILFLAPLGFILACVAAAAVLIAGLTQGIVPPPDGAEFTALVMAATVGIGTLAALPAFLAIVAAEAFGWRSPFYWLGVGALVALIAATTPVGIVMMQAIGTFVVFLISVPRLRDYDGSGAEHHDDRARRRLRRRLRLLADRRTARRHS